MKKINSDINEYGIWVNKDVPLDEGWIEEINCLVWIREEIEDDIGKASDEQRSRIRSLDI